MTIKNIILVLMLFPAQIVCMETKQTMEADVENMLSMCNKRCSFIDDVTQNCTSKCFMDYGKQKEHFLVRKYTQECLKLPFDEKWSFKTDVKSQIPDLINTSAAYDKWENSAVVTCAEDYFKAHAQLMNTLEKEKTRESARFQKEHPVISTMVNLQSKVRGLEKK